MSTEEAIETLERFSEYFTQNNLFISLINTLLWGVMWLFHWIVSFLETVLDQVYTLGGLLEDSQVQSMVDAVMPIAWALMAVAIGIFAYQLITGTQVFKQQIFINIMFAVGIFLALPWLLTQLNTLTSQMYEYGQDMVTTEEQVVPSSLATQIVQQNTVDLVWLSHNNFNENDTGQSNFINDENFSHMRQNEQVIVNPDEDQIEAGYIDYNLNDDHENVFNKYIQIDGEGNKKLEDIEDRKMPVVGVIPEMTGHYYRYDVNYIASIVQLFAVMLAIVATAFKVVRLFMEIAFSKVLAPFVAAVDLSTGQRMKQLVKDIVMNYGALALIPLVMKLYIIAMTWLANQDYNWMVMTIVMIAMSYFLIDGPEIAKKILGVDLGLQDGWRTMMGGLAVAGAGYKGAKALGGATKNLGKTGMQMFGEHRQEKMDKLNHQLREAENSQLGGAGLNPNNIGNDNQSDSALNEQQMFSTDANHQTDTQSSNLNASDISSTADHTNQSDVQDTERTVRDVFESDQLTPEDTERMINSQSIDSTSVNDVLNNAQVPEMNKQALVQELTNGQGNVENKDRMINDILSDSNISTEEKQRMISELTNGQGDVENKQRMIQDILANDHISDDTKQRMIQEVTSSNDVQAQERSQLVNELVNSNQDADTQQRLVNELTTGQPDAENKQRMINDIMANNDLSAESKQRMIQDIISGQDASMSESKQRMINDIMTGSDEATQNRQRNIDELVNGNHDASTQQRLINELTNGQSDVENKQRMINDIMANNDLSSDNKQRVISDMLSQGSNDTKQRMINELTNGQGNIENKQRMVTDLMSNSNVGTEQKQQLINELTNGQGNVENKQRMIQDVMNNESVGTETKQQMIDAVMNNTSMSPETKTQMLNSMTNSSNLDPATQSRMINEITSGQATDQTKQQFVNEVLSGATNHSAQQVQAVQNMLNGTQDLSTKAQQVSQMISSSANDPTTQTRMINELVSNQASDLSTKTQMINQMLSNNDLNPQTKQQLVTQTMQSASIPLETKQQYVNQMFTGSQSTPESQSQLVKNMFSGDYSSPESKTQTITQMLSSENTNPEAKTQMINQMFNTSDQPLTSHQTQTINQMLSGINEQGIDNKQQYVNQILNKANPVAENRTEFINQIQSSQLDDSTKTQLVKQITNPTMNSNPETLTQTINQVMSKNEIGSGLRNNIVNEISKPGSVYKTQPSNYKARLSKIDYSDLF